MNRILALQKLTVDVGELNLMPDPDQQGNSTCSDHNCACSTASQIACFAGSEFVVI